MPRKLTPEELRQMLLQSIDVDELLDHEFEYYIWFRGHSHRLEHQRHENINEAIGQFIFESHAGEAGDQDKVYVFREFELWLTLQVAKWDPPTSREFTVRNHWLEDDETLTFEFEDPDEPSEFSS